MWIWFIVIAFILFIYFYPLRESLDVSPSDMVQEQAGVIQQLHDTISKVTLTEASIDELQDENDKATDQINQLQQNLPSNVPQEQYPVG